MSIRVKRLALPLVVSFLSVVMVSVAVICIFNANKKMPLYYYGLSDRELHALTESVKSWQEQSLLYVDIKPINAIDLSEKKDGGILIYHLSREVSQYSELFVPVQEQMIQRISPLLRSSVEYANGTSTQGGRWWAIPLLNDMAELLCSSKISVPDSGVYSIDFLTEVIGQKKDMYPVQILVAGGDDYRLLDFIGQIVLSRYGINSYQRLCSSVANKEKGFDEIIQQVLFSDGKTSVAFKDILDELLAWEQKGMLHQSWWDFSIDDVRLGAEAGQAPTVFQFLSDHRGMSRDYLEAQTFWPFLADMGKQGQFIVAPMIAASIMPGKSWPEEEAVLSWLSGPEGQAILSAQSGLAPTILSGKAPDIQSRKVRDWVSSYQVVQGLSRDGFADGKSRSEFAGLVRQVLRR